MDKAALLAAISGRWVSQILHAGVKLGVFDALASEPRAADAVARERELDPALSYRLMRALASIGVLREEKDRRFGLAPAGELLRADHPESLRDMVLLEEGPEHYAFWKHLPAIVRDGEQNGFVREFGRVAFEYAALHPEYGEVFDRAMTSYSTTETGWVLDALSGEDFSKVSRVCDVGGGRGHLLSSLLVRYPHLRGTLFERPEVLRHPSALWAKTMNVADRCDAVGGDMFAEAPAADAYFVKHIIHDWNDEECVRILGNMCRSATREARVFIAEYVVPDPATPHFAKLFDVHMMTWGTGRERTSEEYAALLEHAGWSYQGTLHPSAGTIAVVAGKKR
jgi:O-methyltransferase/methyltransferase family protein